MFGETYGVSTTIFVLKGNAMLNISSVPSGLSPRLIAIGLGVFFLQASLPNSVAADADPKDSTFDADCDCGPSDTSGDYNIEVDQPFDGMVVWPDLPQPYPQPDWMSDTLGELEGTWRGQWDDKFSMSIKIDPANIECPVTYNWSEDLEGNRNFEACLTPTWVSETEIYLTVDPKETARRYLILVHGLQGMRSGFLIGAMGESNRVSQIYRNQ